MEVRITHHQKVKLINLSHASVKLVICGFHLVEKDASILPVKCLNREKIKLIEFIKICKVCT